LSVGQSLGDFQGAAIEIERRGVLLGGGGQERVDDVVVAEQQDWAVLRRHPRNQAREAIGGSTAQADGSGVGRDLLVLLLILAENVARGDPDPRAPGLPWLCDKSAERVVAPREAVVEKRLECALVDAMAE
jgi:hypothetical protein